MFSKEDFLHYFDQLLALEREMKESYMKLQDQVQDPEYKKIFAELANEERGHERLVEELMEEFKT